MTQLSFSQRKGPSPSSLSFKLKKEKLLRPKTPSSLMCSRLLFFFFFKYFENTLDFCLLYVGPFCIRCIWHLTHLFKCFFYYCVDNCGVCSVLMLNTCLIWSVHVVDLYIFCDPGRVHSFRWMWLWPLMAVHMMDLYNFTNWLGPSIMFIGVLNVCRVRSLFCMSLIPARFVHFLDLYKFLTHGGVRSLCGLV